MPFNFSSTSFLLKVLPALLLVLSAASPVRAAVKVTKAGTGFVLENAALQVTVEAGGGRISRLIDKKSGKNWVALWNGGEEDGGLLDDRNAFTAMAYHGVVMRPGGAEGTVRFMAAHPSGLAMTKYVTLREDSSEIEVRELFSNGTQRPEQLMLRNFMLPGGGPLTEEYQYFVPQKEKPLQPLAPASGHFTALAAPWSAVWNSQSGDGILVAAPGAEEFYFWQGSQLHPTYEWAYPTVPAGQQLSVQYRIRLIHDAAPDWAQLSADTLKGLRRTRLADVPGWLDEAQRYNVTEAERARGFWLSTGDDAGKRRLPAALRLDVPLHQKRSVYVALNALQEREGGDLTVKFHDIPAGLLQTAWQVRGADSIEVLPFDTNRKVDLENGTEGRLWLTLNGGDKPLEARGEIEIALNGQKVLWPLEVKVWPVTVPPQRPFHVRGYGAYPSALNDTHVITPKSIQRVNAFMETFQAMGGDVFDFTVSWRALYPHLKIAGSDQSVSDWLKENRAAFQTKPVASWPRVDFSYCDPWTEAAQKYGLVRAVTYLPLTPSAEVSAVEEEWILAQLREYFESRGFQGYFCKIGDEISRENLAEYIEQAKVARRAGWRPFTTVTGQNARTAGGINGLNPYLDEWQLNLVTTEGFHDALQKKYRLETRTVEMPARWGPYANGGARDTVAQKLFESVIPAPPTEVENVMVFQDGKPLQRPGGTAWGNQRHGVYFTGYNNSLYLAPFAGTDANTAKITVQYQIRVPDAAGEPLAKIDATDEVWFYGGGSRPYNNTYGYAASYPLKALHERYDGFGWYAFHSPGGSKVVWQDGGSGQVRISPPYIGLRDGWNDACLLAWLNATKKIAPGRFISEEPDAPLRVGTVEEGVYRWKQIVNITDPFILNDARREMLAAATQPAATQP